MVIRCYITASIPDLNIPFAADNPNTINFTFTPNNNQIELPLKSPTTLTLNLPKLTQNSSQWLRGDLAVSDVKFTSLESTGEIVDEFPTSTILKGEIIMAEKSLTVQPNQFIITSNPGITKLRYLQISSPSPPGLQVRVVGKSQSVAVGIDRDFPVQSIRPSFLAGFISPDAIAALLSFCAAVTGYLIPYLFTPTHPNNSPKNPSKSP